MNKSLVENTDIIGGETLQIISKAGKFNQWMYEEIRPYLRGEVLEIGSGIGNISRLALADGFPLVLSDYNKSYLAHLSSEFTTHPNLRQVTSIDLQHPDFENTYRSYQERFDSMFLLNVIEHLKDDTFAVKCCKFMLKPGGHLIILAPAYAPLYCLLDKNLGHYRRYTTNTLGKLVTDNSLTITRKKYFNIAGIAGWLFWGKLFRKRQFSPVSLKLFNYAVPFFRLMDKLIFKTMGLSAIVVGKKQQP